MYTCDRCHKSAPKGSPRLTVTTAKRNKDYPERQTPLKNGKPIGRVVNRPQTYYEDGEKRAVYPSDPGGRGWEIAKEIQLCPSCYDKQS